MHRRLRGAKFSEYLSTYALLNKVGIHPTAVLERRQAVEGYGWFVRDACDAGTVLCVLPLSHAVTAANGNAAGAPLLLQPFSCPRGEVLPSLLQCGGWPELAWRIALEDGAQSSPLWWGWLGSLPDAAMFQQQRAMCLQHCRASPALVYLVPHVEHLIRIMRSEVAAAYDAAASSQSIAPPFARFEWASEVVLSRALLFPKFLQGGAAEHEGDAVELAALPFLDMVNHSAASPNSEIEIATELRELPVWYSEDILSSRLPEPPFAFLTTTEPLLPGQQVLIRYQCSADVGELVGGSVDGATLCQVLRYNIEHAT
jgi:hypothetical protein